MAQLETFDLSPETTRWVPGPDATTEWNAVSGQDGVLQVICYDLEGRLFDQQDPGRSARGFSLRPQVQVYGTAAELGATGPCTLAFSNQGAGPITVALH